MNVEVGSLRTDSWDSGTFRARVYWGAMGRPSGLPCLGEGNKQSEAEKLAHSGSPRVSADLWALQEPRRLFKSFAQRARRPGRTPVTEQTLKEAWIWTRQLSLPAKGSS